MRLIPPMFALLVCLLVLMAGCSTSASPEVPIVKSNEVHFHGDVQFPQRMTFESETPSDTMTESGLGLFNLRHSANSETGVESQFEQTLEDLIDANLEADVSGATGTQ